MKSRKTSLYLILIGLTLLLLFSGCWDRREPENRAYVLATGFGYDDEKDLYKITVQVANPMAPQGGGEDGGVGGEGLVTVAVISAKGHTPFEAARNLTLYMTREPFFAHNKLVVFSKSLAERGIGPVLDYLTREREMRLIAKPIILHGDHITRFMRTEVPMELTPADGLERQIALSGVERAVYPSRSLTEIITILPFPGREVLVGRAMLHDQEEEDYIGGDAAIRGTIHLGGGAVFLEDKMQGWFDERATKGWFYIQGRVKRAILNLLCPCHDEYPLTIEVHDFETTLIPIMEESGPRVELITHAEGRIQSMNCPRGFLEESELTESLNRRMAQAIRNDIEIALKRAQDLESDIFGFGNLFYRLLPEAWEEIEEDWNTLFTTLPVDIEVKTHVRRAGLITRPIMYH